MSAAPGSAVARLSPGPLLQARCCRPAVAGPRAGPRAGAAADADARDHPAACGGLEPAKERNKPTRAPLGHSDRTRSTKLAPEYPHLGTSPPDQSRALAGKQAPSNRGTKPLTPTKTRTHRQSRARAPAADRQTARLKTFRTWTRHAQSAEEHSRKCSETVPSARLRKETHQTMPRPEARETHTFHGGIYSASTARDRHQKRPAAAATTKRQRRPGPRAPRTETTTQLA